MDYSTEQIKEMVCTFIDDKKGRDISVVNVAHLTILTDYFIICSATSTTQVKGIANNVDDELARLGIEPLRREGIADGRWAVLDYGSVIVHIFNDENRLLYCLEQLWSDGGNVERYSESIALRKKSE